MADLHRSPNSSLPENIGLQGYSPVSYFTDGRAEQGVPQHNFVYQGRIYYFTSEEQIEIFKNNPTKYMPRYGEYCPYSLSLGRRVAIDPTNFKIQEGQLLLFHNDVELSTIDIPLQSPLYQEADRQFELIRF